jgi:hypothetical protein
MRTLGESPCGVPETGRVDARKRTRRGLSWIELIVARLREQRVRRRPVADHAQCDRGGGADERNPVPERSAQGICGFRSAEAAERDPSSIVLTVTREAPLPTTADESARWRDELRPFVRAGVSHVLGDFGHVTSTEPVMRFVEEVMAPLRAER